MICGCYRADKNFLGEVGVCWGTAERDACSCGGDKSKCDFYPSVREKEKKPTTNTAEVKAEWTEENTCSRCGEEACAGYDEEPWRTRYCPHCGAKMKNPEEYE